MVAEDGCADEKSPFLEESLPDSRGSDQATGETPMLPKRSRLGSDMLFRSTTLATTHTSWNRNLVDTGRVDQICIDARPVGTSSTKSNSLSMPVTRNTPHTCRLTLQNFSLR